MTRKVDWQTLSFKRVVYRVNKVTFNFKKEQEFSYFPSVLEGGEIARGEERGVRG